MLMEKMISLGTRFKANKNRGQSVSLTDWIFAMLLFSMLAMSAGAANTEVLDLTRIGLPQPIVQDGHIYDGLLQAFWVISKADSAEDINPYTVKKEDPAWENFKKFPNEGGFISRQSWKQKPPRIEPNFVVPTKDGMAQIKKIDSDDSNTWEIFEWVGQVDDVDTVIEYTSVKRSILTGDDLVAWLTFNSDLSPRNTAYIAEQIWWDNGEWENFIRPKTLNLTKATLAANDNPDDDTPAHWFLHQEDFAEHQLKSWAADNGYAHKIRTTEGQDYEPITNWNNYAVEIFRVDAEVEYLDGDFAQAEPNYAKWPLTGDEIAEPIVMIVIILCGLVLFACLWQCYRRRRMHLQNILENDVRARAPAVPIQPVLQLEPCRPGMPRLPVLPRMLEPDPATAGADVETPGMAIRAQLFPRITRGVGLT